MEGAPVETQDIPVAAVEAGLQRPPVKKVAKIVRNLAETYAAPESPNKQVEIGIREAALQRMGVHSSWYNEVLSGEHREPPWVNRVQQANKMTDPTDPDFGKYPKARRKSGIERAMNDFNCLIDPTKPMTDKQNRLALNSLAVAVESFKGYKEISDIWTYPWFG